MSDADDEQVRRLRMLPARSLEEAFALADGLPGRKNASVTQIPDGVSVTVE